MVDMFNTRKKDILLKLDKSSKGDWDKKIAPLCNKINKMKNYYTTSSCAGRVVVLVDKEKKEPGSFLFVSHDLLNYKKLKNALNKVNYSKLVKFKQEPCILHVACRTFKDAEVLLKKAQLAGWKRSGIISHKNKFVCELLSTEKLEFPLMNKGKILVDDDFLELVVKKSNENLKKSWEKIENLGKSLV
ncbi:MAG: tRNA wybutosine-synthesizing 3 family protein [archaeon]